MRTGFSAVLITVALATVAPAQAVASFNPSRGDGGHRAWGLLRLPLLQFHKRTGPSTDGATETSRALEATSGWSTIGFVLNANGRGCYLKVAGQAEFDRAEVLFADGSLSTLELRGVLRGGGLYELLRWEEPRVVVCVRMRARASSAQARVQLLLGD